MRKALIVGIDHYESISSLAGCVNDAHAVKSILDRNSDGTVNFDTMLLTGTGPDASVSRANLKENVRDLFADDNEIALFYFSGHGHIETTGGYLCTSECVDGDDGFSLTDLIVIANKSKARSKIIIIDSCHAGFTGNLPSSPSQSELSEGMTILTASTAEQYAVETNGSGVFTTLLVDALSGAASNLIGEVTPGSIYAHIDQSLGPWEQRPVFKTNVKNFVSLRKVQPPINLADLQRIPEFFPEPGYEFQLDPGYEPESPNPEPIKTAIFAILQKFNRVNLLIPVNAPHMYHAAMESKSCKLTVLGEHYRRLVAKGRL